MKAALYARVSTTDRQNPETQFRELSAYAERRGLEVVARYVDRAPGRSSSRQQYQELLSAARAREFDVVVVAAYDRLSRSLQELVTTLGELNALDVDLISLREGTDTTTPQGRLLFGIMASLAEFESGLISHRVKAGLRRARAEGKRLGRPMTAQAQRDGVLELRSKGWSIRAIADQIGISRSAVGRLVKGISTNELGPAADNSTAGAWDPPPAPAAVVSSHSPASILQLRIELENITPSVWRRILVDEDTSIAELHGVVQIAMGWEDLHLHRFSIRGGSYGIHRDGGVSFDDDPRKVTLRGFALEPGDGMTYEYDFGDGWVHGIEVEDRLDPNPRKRYPACIAGRRACPPEDSGGPWGYAEAIHILRSKRHAYKRAAREALGRGYDPARFLRGEVNRRFRAGDHIPRFAVE